MKKKIKKLYLSKETLVALNARDANFKAIYGAGESTFPVTECLTCSDEPPSFCESC